MGDLAGSFAFRPAGGALSGVDIGDAFGSNDGGRRFRIRYDTPVFNGFSLALSAGEEVLSSGNDNEFYDVGLKYARDYEDVKVDARLGFAKVDGNQGQSVGSLALLHKPTGLNAALAAGSDQENDDDYVYLKLGYIQDWFAFGSTAISLDFYEGDDFAIAGSDSSSVGLALVQRIDESNLEVFATYRTYSFDSSGTDFEDIDVVALGARWKF